MIDLKNLAMVEVDGVDEKDYPDFCDAFVSAAVWADTRITLTDAEMDEIKEQHPGFVHELAHEANQ